MCLAAAVTFEALPYFFRIFVAEIVPTSWKLGKKSLKFGIFLTKLLMLTTILLSILRSAAIVVNYGAPMKIY